ncbi:MAG TPA: hypothetical protein VF532_05445 [Candidatus Angelobacter sp.]
MSMEPCFKLIRLRPELPGARLVQSGLVVALALALFVPQRVQAQGSVKNVTAGDSSIEIAGTDRNPTVAVAPNGITNAKVGDGALSPVKIAGTAATLGSNDFSGVQTITANRFPGAALAIMQTGPGLGLRVSSAAAQGEAIQAICTEDPRSDCFAVNAEGTSVGVQATGVRGVRASTPISIDNESCDDCIGVDSFSAAGTAGLFGTNSGNILIGFGGGGKTFRVDAAGNVFATAYNIGGADFAESVEPAGAKDDYHSGDVVVIDTTARRRVGLARKPYSTLVAGIYSTKPGVLATPYAMDDPRLVKEIPLAIVGIVPCKVSAENGPIRAGDLLVTSATPGYAMKGTERSRMLGAVLGKALEPLPAGKGMIEILVTLQ